MKIVIRAKNLKLTPSLEKYIEEKVNSLEKFINACYDEKYFEEFLGKGKPQCEAWVEIGKTIGDQRKGPIFFAEGQIRFPGKSLRSRVKNKNMRLAINEMKGELQRELKEYKKKTDTQIKKGARKFKKDLKTSPQARFYRKGRIRDEGI
jgi:ribosomal subunit interface protein